MELINFDNAATTFPKPPSVIRAAQEAAQTLGGNAGRGGHALAMRSSEAVFSARETVAELFGAAPENGPPAVVPAFLYCFSHFRIS